MSYEIIQELLDDTGYFEMSAKEYFEKTTLYRTPEQLQNRNKVPYGIIREYLNELRDENSSEKIPSILDPELNDRLLELEKFVMEEDFDEFDVEDRMTMLFGKY